MMNVTNATVVNFEPPRPYNEQYWIISEAILILVTLIDLYFLKSIVSYLWKQKKKRNREQLRVLLGLSLVAVIMAQGRFASNQVLAFLGWQTDHLCFSSYSSSIVFYSASISPVYIFLWMRQHSFYTNKQMQSFNNRKIVFISYACLLLLVVSWIILSVVFLLPEVTGWEYAATQEGCRDRTDAHDFELLPILVNLVAAMGQLSLLGLLLYPLLKVRTQHKRMSVKGSVTKSPTHQKSKKMNNDEEVFVGKSEYNVAINPGYVSTDDASGYPSDGDLAKCASPNPRPHRSTAFFPANFKVPQIKQLQEEELGSQRNSPTMARKQFTLNRKEVTPSRREATINRREATPSHRESTLNRKKSTRKGGTLKKSRTERRRERRLKKLIEKVFFLALICVCSNIVATVLQLLLVQPELVYLVIYDVNLIINIFCIILSFEKWKDILFAWRRSCAEKIKSRTSSVTSQMSLQTITTKAERFFPRRNRGLSSGSSFPSSRPASPAHSLHPHSVQPPVNSVSVSEM